LSQSGERPLRYPGNPAGLVKAKRRIPLVDMRGPRIDEGHVLTGLHHMSAGVSAEEVGAAKTTIDRTEQRLGLKPQRLAADSAYGSASTLGWIVIAKEPLFSLFWNSPANRRVQTSNQDGTYGGRSYKQRTARPKPHQPSRAARSSVLGRQIRCIERAALRSGKKCRAFCCCRGERTQKIGLAPVTGFNPLLPPASLPARLGSCS
jgi:hypothetical protein